MFQCKDLLSLPTMAKVRVISGKKGMSNGIRWVYKAESMDFSRWIHGSELLIISTPVIQKPDFDLLTLIQEAIRYHMSGALLLIGEEYVKAISKKVLRISNEENFPLMVIPGEIPLVDIFEEVGHAIAYHENMENDLEDLLAGIIFGSMINVSSLELKSQMIGYDVTPPQQIFVIHFFQKVGLPSLDVVEKQEIQSRMTLIFQEHGFQLLTSYYSNNFVGMVQALDNTKEERQMVFEEIREYLIREKPEWGFQIGIGKSYDQLSSLQKSFQDASNCIALAQKLGKENEIFWYDRLGFYRLLMSFENTEVLREYCQDIIGTLITYDQENGTQLVETTKAYFENDCNLQLTSEKMFTHRNTIKYRIQRIEQLTGRSFRNSFENLELHNAIIIYEFL